METPNISMKAHTLRLRDTFALAFLTVTCLSITCRADTIKLGATSTGNYNNVGNGGSGPSYIAGRVTPPGDSVFRDFFAFDLTGVNDQISAATLRLSNPSGGYSSVDPTETFTLFDVTTPINTLLNAGHFLQATVFDDLGTGTSYGSVVMSPADNGNIVTITFNAAGLTALNGARGGQFAVGGSVTTLSGRTDNEFVFGFTGSTSNLTQQLVLTTVAAPEPGTVLTCSLGVLLAYAGRRRLTKHRLMP